MHVTLPDLAFCLLIDWELLLWERNYAQFLWLRVLRCLLHKVFWESVYFAVSFFFFFNSVFCSTTFSSFFSLEGFHLSFYYFSFCPFPLLLQHFTVWNSGVGGGGAEVLLNLDLRLSEFIQSCIQIHISQWVSSLQIRVINFRLIKTPSKNHLYCSIRRYLSDVSWVWKKCTYSAASARLSFTLFQLLYVQ